MKKRTNLIYLLLFLLITVNGFSQLSGTTQPITFFGPVTSNNVTFTIYLPPNYSTNTSKYYPVVYHLHGVNGAHDGPQINDVPLAFETAATAGLWDEAIIVFPDGYANSMWADSYDMNKPAETNIIQEIIPYVDANYRTIPDAQHRFMEGFSMGGFGALKFYTKYPSLFCKVVSYDGAIHTWSTLTAAHPDITLEIFNNDSTLFNTQASPWTFLVLNQASFQSDTVINLNVGVLTTYNGSMSSYLNGLSIPHGYVLTGCPHNVSCLTLAEGNNTALFFSECINNSTTSISEIENDDQSFTIFPNPANSFVTVHLNNGTNNAKLNIYNSFGQNIYSTNVVEDESIDISNIPAGVYYIRLNNSEKIETKRLILNR